jgi:hypothetical protein
MGLERAPITVQPHPPDDVGPDAFAGTQCPSAPHSLGNAQSATDVQVVPHAVPEHLYGAQSSREPSGATSMWSPSHDAASRATQVPWAVSQRNIALQSASAAHADPHAVPLHTYGAHDAVVIAVHAPLPVQLAAIVATPSAHDAARHGMLGPTKPMHAVRTTPSHVPAEHASRPAAHAVRACRGAPWMGMQLPGASVESHASHWPGHGVLQHTPSTQNAPNGQAAAVLQAAP